jgi:glycosyltransferase involved in cell wall biosynthesis
MKILMDGRPLLRPWMGGVPRLASLLVPAVQSALAPDELVIVETGRRTQKPLPNKWVAFLTFTGLSSFDRLFPEHQADALFFPNLEFVGRPALPYALLVHDLSFLIEPRWFGWKSRLWHLLVKPKQLIKHATHLFTVSETSKRDLLRLLDIPSDKITVIPLGLDETAPAIETPYGLKGARYILCLGASNNRKNSECVIAAHRELIREEKYKEIKLVVTGMPDYPRPSYEDLFALMRDAAVFCYPSWYEGFGMPLHEAARFGTPCIASTSSSLPETAPAGTRFASPAKPQHWVEALRQGLDNPHTSKTETRLGTWNEAGQIIAKKLQDIAKT